MTTHLPGAATLLAALLALAASRPVSLAAQRGATLRLVGPGYTTATGALRVPVSREEIQLQAQLVDAAGTPGTLGGCTVRWTSSVPEQLQVTRVAEGGQSAWVVARAEGRPVIRAVASCDRLTAELPAVIGRAGLEGEPVRAATEEQAAYLPAAIKISPTMGRGADGTLRLTAGEGELQVIAEVRDPAGGLLGADAFPVAWVVSDTALVGLRDDSERSAYVTPKAAGTTTLTVRAEGVSASMPVVVSAGATTTTVATATRAGVAPTGGVTSDRMSAPPAPADLAGTATRVGEVTLRWTGAPGVSYEVHRSASPQGPFTKLAEGLTPPAGSTAMSYTSTKLYPTGTFYHQVVASSPTAATTSESPVVATSAMPNAQPAGLKATYHSSNGTIEISWQPVPGASGYMLTRSDGKPVNGNKLIRGATQFADPTPASSRLTYAVTPYFPVAPEFNLPTIEQGEMPGPAGTPPTALVGLWGGAYRAGNTVIRADVSKVPGAKATYLVRAQSLNSSDWMVVASAAPDRGWLEYANAPIGAQYAYRVQAVFPDGSIAWGAPKLLTLAPPPAGPALSATSANGSVTVSWAPVAGALDYNVTRWRGTQSRQWLLQQSGAQLSVTETGLTPGETVKFVVTVGYPSRDMSSKSEITVTVQ